MNLKGYKDILDWKKEDSYTYVLLLSAPILLTLYRYFSMSGNMLDYWPSLLSYPQSEIYSVMLQHVGFSILVMLFPLLTVLIFFKGKYRQLGLSLGDKKYGLRVLLLGIPSVVLIAYLGAYQTSVQSEYPIAKSLLSEPQLFWSYQIVYILFYYIAWEFFFRGFLLFGLKDSFGGFNAILIQTISSCLVHIDKPVEEILGSILAGIIFGILALRSGSFWYCFILHAALGFFTDFFIINLW